IFFTANLRTEQPLVTSPNARTPNKNVRCIAPPLAKAQNAAESCNAQEKLRLKITGGKAWKSLLPDVGPQQKVLETRIRPELIDCRFNSEKCDEAGLFAIGLFDFRHGLIPVIEAQMDCSEIYRRYISAARHFP